VVLDEFADMKPEVWHEVVRPMLADRKGWATFIGTPKGKNEFWKTYRPAWCARCGLCGGCTKGSLNLPFALFSIPR
jgi:hypothetical protein